jgi:hypothetical protein
MSWPRLGAAMLAGVGIAFYVTLLVLGNRVGWVVEVGGPPGAPPELLDLWVELPWLTVLLVGILVGSGLAARMPRHAIPWLMIAAALGNLLYPVIVLVVARALEAAPAPAWAPSIAWAGNWIWVVGQVGLFYLLLLFPDGRPLSGRWRQVGRLGAVYIGIAWLLVAAWPNLEAAPALANPFGIEALRAWEGALLPFILGFVALQVLASVSLILRFVRSTGVERQQMKWMAFGAALFVVTSLAGVLPRWTQAISSLILILALVVAVTRYRLYEIDRIISRTLTYALLTVVLAGVYVAGVVGLGSVARAMTGGGGNDLVVAASTLAAAAVFVPTRRRIQRHVDRRFNRARYDARRTVEALAHRLRDQTDLDALVLEVEQAVAVAIGPRGLSLWVRPTSADALGTGGRTSSGAVAAPFGNDSGTVR